jgi:hypothetical protein
METRRVIRVNFKKEEAKVSKRRRLQKKATIQNDRTRNHMKIETRHEFLREQGVNQQRRADGKGEDPRGQEAYLDLGLNL